MNRAPVFGGVAAIVLIALALLAFSGGDARRLEVSPLGSAGLARWLPSQGVDLQRSNRRLSPQADTFGLRILPVLDTDLTFNDDWREEDDASRTSMRQISAYAFAEKLESLTTLVVLPKWRQAVINEDIAHDSYLIPLDDMDRLVSQTDLAGTLIQRDGPTFAETRISADNGYDSRDIALFHAQFFGRSSLPGSCREVFGLYDGALLVRCKSDIGSRVSYYLSDPDLLNNHGLSLAENAAFAVDMISSLKSGDEDRPVYLDLHGEVLLSSGEANEQPRPYERTSEDFARFFQYPLSAFWAIALAVLAVAFWRGSWRFGPPAKEIDDRVETSKTAAISAKARLLRLSGNDGAMTAAFVGARLHDMALARLGPGQSEERFFALVARRNAKLAEDLRAVSVRLVQQGPTLPQAELYRQLQTFTDLLERVEYELG